MDYILITKERTPSIRVNKNNYVTCSIVPTNNKKLKVILHHQTEPNSNLYADHTYIVDLEINRKQYEDFRNRNPCPINESAILSKIIVKR